MYNGLALPSLDFLCWTQDLCYKNKKKECAFAVHTTLREDDVTHLMASGHATVQMMHKTPSLWRRAKMP